MTFGFVATKLKSKPELQMPEQGSGFFTCSRGALLVPWIFSFLLGDSRPGTVKEVDLLWDHPHLALAGPEMEEKLDLNGFSNSKMFLFASILPFYAFYNYLQHDHHGKKPLKMKGVTCRIF